jgi:mono/diheme cytochrome c family protein
MLLVGAALAQDVANGAMLAALARCAACHTAPGGVPFAGGYAIETRFGTFYGSNLTPDPVFGVGVWTEADFVRAMRDGRAPDGRRYFPAFPYPSFTHLTDADLADLWAWLRTLPPDPTPSKPHDTGLFGRWTLGFWQALELPRKARGPYWETSRGSYLVDGAGHCGECHSARDAIGGMSRRGYLAGNPDPPAPAPAITEAGLAGWTTRDLVDFLESGMTSEGDFVGGEMRAVIRDGTAKLSEADREAIAEYLLAVQVGP